MTIEEQGAIIEAYKRGEEIEIGNRQGEWVPLTFKYPIEYNFNFQVYRYRIKKKRWRGSADDTYFYIDGVIKESNELYTNRDDERYAIGNYFRTREEALKAKELIKDLLIKFHNS